MILIRFGVVDERKRGLKKGITAVTNPTSGVVQKFVGDQGAQGQAC